VKIGENKAVVTKTGVNTFIGRAESLVREDKGLVCYLEKKNITHVNFQGHFQKVLHKIGWFCFVIIFAMVFVELMVQFVGRHRLLYIFFYPGLYPKSFFLGFILFF
jgi:H+-transporting ATPase